MSKICVYRLISYFSNYELVVLITIVYLFYGCLNFNILICWELLRMYIKGSRDLRLISLDLSWSLLTLHLPKPLSLTPNLFLKDFSA